MKPSSSSNPFARSNTATRPSTEAERSLFCWVGWNMTCIAHIGCHQDMSMNMHNITQYCTTTSPVPEACRLSMCSSVCRSRLTWVTSTIQNICNHAQHCTVLCKYHANSMRAQNVLIYMQNSADLGYILCMDICEGCALLAIAPIPKQDLPVGSSSNIVAC